MKTRTDGIMKRRLSISQKSDILAKLSEPGASQSSVAKSMNVSCKTIRNVVANQDILRRYMDSGASLKKCHLKIDEKYAHLNEATFKWFQRIREKHGEIPITEAVVCKKATEFANRFGVETFKASKGWYRSWKNKHGLNVYKICGEAKDAPLTSIDDFLKSLPTLIGNYDEKDVFNCDETALYYRVLSSKTLESSHCSAIGRKVSKERVTLMLCGSMCGEKLVPLVIGKYRSPRCFHGSDVKNLPCLYNNSQNGWMTSNLFHSWLLEHHPNFMTETNELACVDMLWATPDSASKHAHIGESTEVNNVRVAMITKVDWRNKISNAVMRQRCFASESLCFYNAADCSGLVISYHAQTSTYQNNVSYLQHVQGAAAASTDSSNVAQHGQNELFWLPVFLWCTPMELELDQRFAGSCFR
ncbi:hypothetical protein B566_EDAN019502 [Ephemera danica]|nr:hypothetical protein B566_EDAN019502 [Ephemera danica]